VLGELQPDPESSDSFERSRICAAVVTYNIGEAINRCFDSIRSQVAHVIIVDNGSGETTRRALDKLETLDCVTLILNERNEGLAHAYNQAVRWARDRDFQWILTLDHDSEATPGMVDKLAKAYATLASQGIKNVGVIGANPFDVNIRRYLLNGPRGGCGTHVEDQAEVISSGSLIPLRIFDLIGFFNEDIFIYYVDTDFCMRVTRHGLRVYLCTDAVMLHREGLKSYRRFLWWETPYTHYGRIARYYLTRNLVYMLSNHSLPPGYALGLLRSNWEDHMKILLFDAQRFRILWFSLRGLIDGLRGKVGPISFGF